MTILVFGDYIEDQYILGEVEKISPEFPVPVIKNPNKITMAGGAGNVCKNIKALGSHAKLITNAEQRIIKQRIGSGTHIYCRIDYEDYVEYNITEEFDENLLTGVNYAVLSDYNKGSLHHSEKLIKLLNRYNIKTLIDPKKPFSSYRDCWLIKANRKEFETEVGYSFPKLMHQRNHVSDLDLGEACYNICDQYNIKNLIITDGQNGLYLYSFNGSAVYHLESDQHPVRDVTGAGDVVIASIAHYLEKGLDLYNAVDYANKLAGISVTYPGTHTLTKEDILKVENIVVFTNGCFDLLHAGHVGYLKESKKLGTKLIVGLNSDESIKRLKGENRPIVGENNRKLLLESLEFVDEVIIFNEDTPYELIKKIKPDVITKGGDYTPAEVVGNDLARVVIIPTIEEHSTTNLINAAKELAKNV